MAQEEYQEKKVAENIGVPHRTVQELRKNHLTEGTHYSKHGGFIFLEKIGLAKLMRLLGIDRESRNNRSLSKQFDVEVATVAEKSKIPEKTPRPGPEPGESREDGRQGDPEPGEIRELVFSRKYTNPRVVGATLNGEVQRVRVQNNKNFRRGMILPCRYMQEDFWELARKCPRRPGRW